MENINRIIETFKDEKEIVIICSKELALKLNQEIADFNTKTDGQQGFFKNENKIDLGFNSILKNGVTLHYTSDFQKLIEGIKKMD
jgi:hypothetical protein